MNDLYVRIRDGSGICVPPSLKVLTTYVLLEQEDWFETEIGFVRRVLRPGMRAIDIGANFGIYTVAMARAVGTGGCVFAYEPATATATYLRRTIAHNQLDNVQLCQAALSDRAGTARLRIDENAELNSLSDEPGTSCEQVEVSTLDLHSQLHGWGRIDFVKIDAEGEEANIVAGGGRFFAEQSPLVMFELKHNDQLNAALLPGFRNHGYAIYRLIGPDTVLVPFEDEEGFSDLGLNLFACKPDRATVLAAAGLLVMTPAVPAEIAAGLGVSLWRRQAFASAFDRPLSTVDQSYARALDAYATWRDEERPAAERCGALLASLAMLRTLAVGPQAPAHLATLGRVATEAGRRAIAAKAAFDLAVAMEHRRPQIDEPFWPIAQRFDAIVPGAQAAEWFLAAAIEAYEQLRAFTSYFRAFDTLAAIDWVQSTPFASAAMERRRQLIGMRAGRQSGMVATRILAQARADNLNPQIWAGLASTPAPHPPLAR